MIHEILTVGNENARTCKELAHLLGCTTRDISKQIERERRAGYPICAATGKNPGYFLAANEDELYRFCEQLRGRAIEIFKTRKALMKVPR